MGQFIDYLASVFTGKVEQGKDSKENANNHVTFADNSFTQAFTRGDTEKAAKLNSLKQSNKRTIYTYQGIGVAAFLAYLTLVTVPNIQLESFDLLQPEGWQLITMTIVPLIIHLASISAMSEVNRPLAEGAKLSAKNTGLDLNNNTFILSLKVIIILVAICQISSIFSYNSIWLVFVIVPVWCYQLTAKIARSEYERFAPSPKKQLFKGLNIAKSPVKSPASKVSVSKQDDLQTRATPRTRTRRAVKNIITGVSDKYHAFEQNVAHQISQKIFTPLSPKLKMIE